MSHQHWIAKEKIRDTKWERSDAPLGDNQVRLSLDAFALTANNVTYAAFGDAPLFYWNFFPAEDGAWGRVPVWGFATVTESNLAEISPGRRVYGYFPISETLDVTPVRLSDYGFTDGAEHRQAMAPIYNAYAFTDKDPSYIEEYEAEQMLFRPLYMTGWMICDSLCEGAPATTTAILSSASSKTALATAHALQARGRDVIGVTSEGNRGYVEASGLYTKTITYDELAKLSGLNDAAYVDFNGNLQLRDGIHQALGDGLKRSLIIGVTDWEADKTPVKDMPGPEPEFFFAPGYVQERAKTLPKGELQRMMLKDILAFYPISRKFVTPDTVTGMAAVDQAWHDTVEGKVAPDRGLICKL